ncbi:MAG TPA: TPM domain-containing protein [Planctomycetota bacterium]
MAATLLAPALAALGLLLGSGRQELVVPAVDGWVVDRAGILSEAEERELETLAESYRTGSGHEVALLTVPDLGGRSIEELALATARAWKIGDRETSSGALLVVALEERALRIEVGRGLEGTLTDATCGRIIRDVLVPGLRAGRTYAALRAGIEAIHAAAGGDYGPLERARGAPEVPELFALAFGVLFLLVVLGVMRRVHRGLRGGDGALPWILASQLGRSHGGGGFGSFSGGGSSGGFGGFGGGGGFSGGGASGRW